MGRDNRDTKKQQAGYKYTEAHSEVDKHTSVQAVHNTISRWS